MGPIDEPREAIDMTTATATAISRGRKRRNISGAKLALKRGPSGGQIAAIDPAPAEWPTADQHGATRES